MQTVDLPHGVIEGIRSLNAYQKEIDVLTKVILRGFLLALLLEAHPQACLLYTSDAADE